MACKTNRSAGEPVVLRPQVPVRHAEFSPDGRWVVSAAAGGIVRVWDWMGGDRAVALRGHRLGVFSAAFSPDDQHRIVSAGNDGTVRVWNCAVCGPIEEVLALADERVTRELTCDERATFLNAPPCP